MSWFSLAYWFPKQDSQVEQRVTMMKGQLEAALQNLREAAKDPAKTEMCTSSLAYLARADVLKQAQDIAIELEISESHGALKTMLGLAFLEIEVKAKDEKMYTMNFWPCRDCACVAVHLFRKE